MKFKESTPETRALIKRIHNRCLAVNGGSKRVAFTLGVNESTLHDWFGSGRLKKPPSIEKISLLLLALEECEEYDRQAKNKSDAETQKIYNKIILRNETNA